VYSASFESGASRWQWQIRNTPSQVLVLVLGALGPSKLCNCLHTPQSNYLLMWCGKGHVVCAQKDTVFFLGRGPVIWSTDLLLQAIVVCDENTSILRYCSFLKIPKIKCIPFVHISIKRSKDSQSIDLLLNETKGNTHITFFRWLVICRHFCGWWFAHIFGECV
jgi:hypothetical protein